MFVAAALFACSTPFSEEDPPPYVELAVDPAELTVYTEPAGVEPVEFSVYGVRADGQEELLPEAEWTLSNRTVGEIDTFGEFSPSVENGGVSNVTARFAGLTGSSLLTVVFSNEVVAEGVDPTVFDGPRTVQDGLWTYPSDGVNLPRNTPSLVFQWADVGATAAKLRFRSGVTDLTVYTTGTSWEADEATWASLVGTNAGGAVQVELSLAVGTEVWTEEIITVNVNRFDARGSIYYWTTSASGVRQIDYGESAVDYLTASTTGHCVGCHAVKAGQIAFTYDGGNGGLGLVRIADGSSTVAYGSGYYSNFQTFSPDGGRLLTAYMGALLLYDTATGAMLGEVPVDGWATMPDWSPDGTRVAFVQTNGDGQDWTFTGGRIAVMDVAPGDAFGTPTVIYDPPDPYNAYYPAWSPDGEWIAFNVSTGDAYADPDATLHTMAGDGTRVVALAEANTTGADLVNSWPRWGPLPDDDVLWLAFSSNRTYGNVTAGNPQLWVTGFDPARAAAGQDPSWPAFWLPGQDPTQNNHIPVWAE